MRAINGDDKRVTKAFVQKRMEVGITSLATPLILAYSGLQVHKPHMHKRHLQTGKSSCLANPSDPLRLTDEKSRIYIEFETLEKQCWLHPRNVKTVINYVLQLFRTIYLYFSKEKFD
jgi:hypothetical protein